MHMCSALIVGLTSLALRNLYHEAHVVRFDKSPIWGMKWISFSCGFLLAVSSVIKLFIQFNGIVLNAAPRPILGRSSDIVWLIFAVVVPVAKSMMEIYCPGWMPRKDQELRLTVSEQPGRIKQHSWCAPPVQVRLGKDCGRDHGIAHCTINVGELTNNHRIANTPAVVRSSTPPTSVDDVAPMHLRGGDEETKTELKDASAAHHVECKPPQVPELNTNDKVQRQSPTTEVVCDCVTENDTDIGAVKPSGQQQVLCVSPRGRGKSVPRPRPQMDRDILSGNSDGCVSKITSRPLSPLAKTTHLVNACNVSASDGVTLKQNIDDTYTPSRARQYSFESA